MFAGFLQLGFNNQPLTMFYRDTPDNTSLSHKIHERVLDPDQDVGGHPVTAALLNVGAWGVRVVPSRRGRSRRHWTVTHWTRAWTSLEAKLDSNFQTSRESTFLSGPRLSANCVLSANGAHI